MYMSMNCLTPFLPHSTHVIDVSFFLSPFYLFFNDLRLTRRSITVRYTRNHLATDVQYIASKRVVIPDPLKVQSVSLSNLGFVKSTQQLVVRIIFPP